MKSAPLHSCLRNVSSSHGCKDNPENLALEQQFHNAATGIQYINLVERSWNIGEKHVLVQEASLKRLV